MNSWQENRECQIGSQTGTCMSRSQCRKEGGASGAGCGVFGTCCLIQRPCGSRTNRKVSYLERFGNNYQSCSYTISAFSSKVCQVRLDFETFSLAQPDPSTNLCVDDWVNFGPITLCGENSGQHIYVPLNYTNGVRQIDFTFHLSQRQNSLNNLIEPRWRIKVTQLECPDRIGYKIQNNGHFRNNGHQKGSFDDNFWLAPPGCLQYYPQMEGEFSSFNLASSGDGPYLANLDYAICFRRDDDTRFLELSAKVFRTASNAGNTAGLPGFDEECQLSEVTAGEKEDFLEIPGGMVDEAFHSKICSSFDSTNIIKSISPGPLYVRFVSDELVTKDEIGFRFQYYLRN